MDSWRPAERVLAGLIVLAALAAGPAVGLVDVTDRNPTTVGDGDAAATVVSDPAAELRVTAGRFGTDVRYLRVPPVDVRVGDVRGTPRLLYRVQVPALDIDISGERLVTAGEAGRVRLTASDRALDPGVSAGTYEGRVAVRVQSFEVDRHVLNETVDLEVGE